MIEALTNNRLHHDSPHSTPTPKLPTHRIFGWRSHGSGTVIIDDAPSCRQIFTVYDAVNVFHRSKCSKRCHHKRYGGHHFELMLAVSQLPTGVSRRMKANLSDVKCTEFVHRLELPSPYRNNSMLKMRGLRSEIWAGGCRSIAWLAGYYMYKELRYIQ